LAARPGAVFVCGAGSRDSRDEEELAGFVSEVLVAGGLFFMCNDYRIAAEMAKCEDGG
jgi:hypothetical protein